MRYTSLLLVLVCVIVFVVQMLVSGFTNMFLLDSSIIWQRPWTLITAVFLHGSPEHLVFNMFALALFGFILENIIGTKRFLIIFFAGGIIAGIGSIFFYSASLGASGAIFAVIGMLAVIRYKMSVWVFGVPMPMAVAAGIWAIADIVGVFYPSDVANIAHLSGLVFGIVYGFYIKKWIKSENKKERTKILSDKELEQWENEYLK
ncbi:MAG: rhomboid family intramembrane serine protease [Candidatus Aenigmatarchaeota archaeon]